VRRDGQWIRLPRRTANVCPQGWSRHQAKDRYIVLAAVIRWREGAAKINVTCASHRAHVGSSARSSYGESLDPTSVSFLARGRILLRWVQEAAAATSSHVNSLGPLTGLADRTVFGTPDQSTAPGHRPYL
jgi:hypothetical protein